MPDSCHPTGDPHGTPGSWLPAGPALASGSLVEVNQDGKSAPQINVSFKKRKGTMLGSNDIRTETSFDWHARWATMVLGELTAGQSTKHPQTPATPAAV